jgi:hypothetical protein
MHERVPSISAVGGALLALDRELEDLMQQDERLMSRRRLIHEKQKICQETIKLILLNANGGVYPPPCPIGGFPELD